jgi:hypothetical protein
MIKENKYAIYYPERRLKGVCQFNTTKGVERDQIAREWGRVNGLFQSLREIRVCHGKLFYEIHLLLSIHFLREL